jgi:hypothetical protein
MIALTRVMILTRITTLNMRLIITLIMTTITTIICLRQGRGAHLRWR